MRRTITTTMPPSPAQTVTHVEVTCDDCGSQNGGCGRSGRDFVSCSVCSADLCSKCRCFDPYDNSDYADQFCQACMALYEAAHPEIAAIRHECDERIGAIREALETKAKEVRKAKVSVMQEPRDA